MAHPGQIFQRIQAPGWLVLAGSRPEPEAAPAWVERLLAHSDTSRPVHWLETEREATEPSEFLNEIEELASSPVEPVILDDPDWEGAGLLMVSDRTAPLSLTASHIASRLLACLQSGALLAAFGAPALAFGEVLSEPSGTLVPGLAWLPGSILLAGPAPTLEDPPVRSWLRSDRRLALRLPPAAVLALGPEGELEVWGGEQPGVTFGPGWSRP